jgi:GT2 family glycosyltransferase
MTNKIAIVIPFFNNSDYTIKCIESIVHDANNLEICLYLIDDGSSIENEYAVKSYLSDHHKTLNYKYKKGNGTWWWAKSLSIGLEEAYSDGFELFLMMNNDNIIQKGSLNNLVNIFLDNYLEILGSIVVFKNNKIKHCGVVFDENTGKILHNHMYEDINTIKLKKDFIKTDSLGGQGVLISKKVIEKLGYLDYEIFPQYGSDLDFYLRAKQKGIEVYVTHQSVIIDDEENTGLLKSEHRLSFSNFIKSFYSIKSHMSIFVKYNIYKRHVGNKYLIRLIFLYIKYIINFLLK